MNKSSDKSKIVCLVLCILLGYFGAHYFYVGRGQKGFIYLVTLGFLGIGWIIDIITIYSGNFKDSFEIPIIN